MWQNNGAQLLTSFAATLLDPLRVCDIVMTSFAVEKCSTSDIIKMFSTYDHQTTKSVISCLPGQPDYLFTSLASLAIKNPSVPSCILTWLPGLMRILGSQKNRQIMLINFWTTLISCTQHANQEEWYTHLLKLLIGPACHLYRLAFRKKHIIPAKDLRAWFALLHPCFGSYSHGWTECSTA